MKTGPLFCALLALVILSQPVHASDVKTPTPRAKTSSSSQKYTQKKDEDLSLDKTETKLVPSNKGMYSKGGGSRGSSSVSHGKK